MRAARWIGGFVLLCGIGATPASAQHVVGGRFAGGPAPYMVLGGPVDFGAAGQPGGMIYPYSYSVTAPLPARGYVPYGANDIFPYYGRPYGHAYDKWTWESLSGGSSLARYYYPPVR
jgi:hypothetical protein